MANPVAACPMCGCLNVVVMFTGDESEAQSCVSCKGRYVILKATSKGEFRTRIHESMESRQP